MKETTWIEFEVWKDETCICGYMALDEADDEAPLQFYNRNGLECGSNIRNTIPCVPSNPVEEEIVADWEKLVEWFTTTDIVQWLVDFAEESTMKTFDDGIELFINCSKLDAVSAPTLEDKDTTIRVKQTTKEKLKMLGSKGETYDEIIRSLL